MSVPRFWREIPQRYNLQATRCGECQATHFPPREVCPTCRRASLGRLQAVKLAGRGTIVEWTRIHRPAPGYELQLPYVVALIQTPEGPVLTGQVVDSDLAAIVPGAPVRAVFRRIGQDGEAGVIHYGTKWVIDAAAAPDVSPSRPESTKTPPKGAKAAGRRWRKPGVQTT